ncbi:MAG: hypothetical protein LQ349_007634 [Xanthoria aureola]|nr:MAG: hypothetical protein LQ349_007634 [Xanthoria aureola]
MPTKRDATSPEASSVTRMTRRECLEKMLSSPDRGERPLYQADQTQRRWPAELPMSSVAGDPLVPAGRTLLGTSGKPSAAESSGKTTASGPSSKTTASESSSKTTASNPSGKTIASKDAPETNQSHIYDNLERQLMGKIMVPGSNLASPGKWSLKTHRQLQMLAMSLELPRWDTCYDFKATNLKNIYQDKHYADKLIKDKYPLMETQKPEFIASYVHLLCQGSPKMRALLKNIRDQTIRDEEKAIIFCQIPAVTVLLWAVFHLIGLKVAVVTSFQSHEERQGIIDEFNRRGSGL